MKQIAVSNCHTQPFFGFNWKLRCTNVDRLRVLVSERIVAPPPPPPPPPPKNSLFGLHKIKIVSFSFHTDPIWYVQKCQNQLNSAWKVSGGWGFSKVVATFNHVGGYFNLFIATIGDVSIIPSFRIGDYVLHVEHVSCVITNCGQHQWVIPSTLSIAL